MECPTYLLLGGHLGWCTRWFHCVPSADPLHMACACHLGSICKPDHSQPSKPNGSHLRGKINASIQKQEHL